MRTTNTYRSIPERTGSRNHLKEALGDNCLVFHFFCGSGCCYHGTIDVTPAVTSGSHTSAPANEIGSPRGSALSLANLTSSYPRRGGWWVYCRHVQIRFHLQHAFSWRTIRRLNKDYDCLERKYNYNIEASFVVYSSILD